MRRTRMLSLKGGAIGLPVIGIALSLLWLKPYLLEQLDAKFIDVKFIFRGPRPPGGEVVLVAIDKKAIHATGRWPWSRKTMADLVTRIAQGAPRVIGLDFLYSQTDENNPRYDELLAEAMRRSGRVVGCSFFCVSPDEAGFQSQEEYERNLRILRDNTVGMVVDLKGRGGDLRVLPSFGIECNIPPISEALCDCGFYNAPPEADGSVRRLPLLIKSQEHIFYSLAVAALKCSLGTRMVTLTVVGDYPEELKIGGLTVPLDSHGRLFLNYYGTEKVFPLHSASDVLSGKVPPSAFEGKIVLVGGMSLGEFDTLVSPFTPTISSIAIQATCIENILHGDYLIESILSRVLTVCTIVLCGLLFVAVLPRVRPLLGGLWFLACLAAFLAGNFLIFSASHVQASTIYPLLAILGSYGVISVNIGLARERRAARLRAMLAQVSEEIDAILDMGALLPRMLESVVDFVEGDRGVLIARELGERGERRFAIRAQKNLGPGGWEGEEFACGREVVRRVEKAMEGTIILKPRKDRKLPLPASRDGYAPGAILCFPLKTKNRLVGIIYVDQGEGRRRLDQWDLTIICSFASQWAIAVENAALYSKIKQAEERLVAENIYLKKSVPGEHRFRNIIGRSAKMRELFALLERLRDTATTVLIEGETGTGKEIVAQAIHASSPRGAKTFIAQNCAALPETLLESELFGHARGAFTGAVGEKRGLFEIADGGTVFLDEIGSTSPGLQAALLRVLQEGTLRPVGSEKEIRVDVRVIAASNKDLEAEVKAGRFRADLFYRLNVFPVTLPPLRERKDDIPLLAANFLEFFCSKLNKKITGISEKAMELLVRHDFPGNVRELENEIERAVNLTDDGQPITAEVLSEKFRTMAAAAAFARPMPGQKIMLRAAVDDFERQVIRTVLAECGGNRSAAAELLGLSRMSLHRKLKEHKIE